MPLFTRVKFWIYNHLLCRIRNKTKASPLRVQLGSSTQNQKGPFYLYMKTATVWYLLRALALKELENSIFRMATGILMTASCHKVPRTILRAEDINWKQTEWESKTMVDSTQQTRWFPLGDFKNTWTQGNFQEGLQFGKGQAMAETGHICNNNSECCLPGTLHVLYSSY